MKRITLRAARRRVGLTQVQLQKASRVDQSYISKLELGKILNPPFSKVVRLAKPLGIDPQVLTFDKPEPEALSA